MENWAKISREEISKVGQVVGLKKKELQTALIKALVEQDKLKQEKKELIEWLEEIRNKPVALFPETQEQAEEVGKVKFCIEVLERLGEKK